MSSDSPFDSGKTVVFKTMSTAGSKHYLNCSPGASKSISVYMDNSIELSAHPGCHWRCTKHSDDTYQLQTVSTGPRRLLDSSSSASSDESAYLKDSSAGGGSHWVPSLESDGSYILSSQTPSGPKCHLMCNPTASKEDSVFMSMYVDPIETHWIVGVDYYCESEVHDIIHSVYPGATITSYFKALGHYASLDFDLLSKIWRDSKLGDIVRKALKFDNNDFAVRFKAEVGKYSYNIRYPDFDMASLCGIMWGITAARVSVAFNFTIDPFRNLILFDPVHGEQIPHDRYTSLEFCIL